MRIFSIIVTLPMLIALHFPQMALAQETVNTNTKINFELKDNLMHSNNSASDVQIPYTYSGYQPMENPDNLERNIKLAMRKKKSIRYTVPRGTMTINASAYTAAADECGKSDGITASGLKVKTKRTLACPPQYPFGTKVKIEGMGTYTCEDRGGAIKGNKFDIYVETKTEAFQFGRRHLMAEVI
jgi:3D (Asp-Asp-Asp) domain-containing protein